MHKRCKFHKQRDMVFRNVRRYRGVSTLRGRCSRCKETLDLPPNSNLIGNPFRILELTEGYLANEVLSYVDEILAKGDL